jgi:hypothetical protein
MAEGMTEGQRAGAGLLGVVATLLAMAAGCPSEAARRSAIEPPAAHEGDAAPEGRGGRERGGEDDVGRAGEAGPGPEAGSLADFAAQYRREVDDLGTPTRLFLWHESAAPRGFVDLARQQHNRGRLDRARMFAFDFADPSYGSCGDRVVESDGTICSSAVYPGNVLTEAQTQEAAAVGRAAPGSWSERARTRCFEPHHSVVFFGDRGEPVAEITICFECGTLRIEPGPADDAQMTEEEARFFAETCRALGVGGCPPAGASRLPDLPPPAESALPEEAAAALRVRRALARDHGIPSGRRLRELSSVERDVLCAWIDSGMRLAVATGHFTCKDGRTIARGARERCQRTPSASCSATVGDLTACLRARVDPLCGPDTPGCARSDQCRWGVFAEQDAGAPH